MESAFPIYTAATECQDCYKCVRACPVKAISIVDGKAAVVPERCVACGTCVLVCPAKAKRVREDRSRAAGLLRENRPVYVSLAPAWVSEFPGITPGQMIGGLRRLGFAGVGETALGAQEVSATVAGMLGSGRPGLYLSSACPAAVRFVGKYLPEHFDAITKVDSPVLAHCRLMRKTLGKDIRVVFIGPCIAKKTEADNHPELLDVALTFPDLRAWFKDAGIDLDAISPSDDDAFVVHAAEEGACYPVEGGMVATMRACGDTHGARFVSLSGLRQMRAGLAGLDAGRFDTPVFVECLACEGGCINGPCSDRSTPTVARRLGIEARVTWPSPDFVRTPSVPVELDYAETHVDSTMPDEATLRDALASVGKLTREDELNCGGCGYSTCRNFAWALVEGRAEPTMCASFMRRQAQNKANALLRCMPSGVVIADHEGRIIECNERFARLFGDDTVELYQVKPGLQGCVLAKIVPFAELFQGVLRTGEEVHYDHLKVDGRLFNVTIFPLEQGLVVGAVIQDVTRQELQRDQIAQKANEVITRNLSTVQEIACRLGEHMAETEILLRSISEGYASEPPTSHLQAIDRIEDRDDSAR